MNPLVSLLRWSIKGMRKEHTRVPLVGFSLAGQTFRGGGTSGNYRQVFVSDANIPACPHKRHLGAHHRDYHVILR